MSATQSKKNASVGDNEEYILHVGRAHRTHYSYRNVFYPTNVTYSASLDRKQTPWPYRAAQVMNGCLAQKYTEAKTRTNNMPRRKIHVDGFHCEPCDQYSVRLPTVVTRVPTHKKSTRANADLQRQPGKVLNEATRVSGMGATTEDMWPARLKFVELK